MTKKPTPEPAEEPVRIKLSGDMQKSGGDAVLVTVNDKPIGAEAVSGEIEQEADRG